MTRFGRTVYILSSLFAALFLVVGLVIAFTAFRDGTSVFTGFIIVGMAILIWLIGHMARNVIDAESGNGPPL
jgi:high-affinity Fe2+/Pb2+ permease